MEYRPIIYAFIFARGGSKGLPNKNILPLAGKPLIAYAIETAKQVPRISRIIVSTDDEQIAKVAREYGAEVPFMRPDELATDTCAERLAWRHALQEVGNTAAGGPCDIFVSLPCTAPLRSAEDVENCINMYIENDCDAVITSSCAQRHPMFNMVCENDTGEVSLVMPSTVTRRQDAPMLFDVTTAVYVVKPEFIFSEKGLLEGRVRQVVLPRERAVDIDDKLDFEFAEFLLTRNKIIF